MDLPDWLGDRLARLQPDQRAAATAPPGPVLCVAPAGSGKTTTLVARVAWRMHGGDDPDAMCAVTFNRRAADELRERVDAALSPAGVPAGRVRIRTFHALGREILADAGVDVSRLVDRAEVLASLAGGPLPAAALRLLDDAFSRITLDPTRGPPPSDAAVHAAYAAYRAELARTRSLDFDDLVAGAVTALGADGSLLDRWRRRCAVLFVDEAQDLDRAQLELALLLAGDARDVFLVGDDDQTIYAWRLADVRRVLGLAARLPGLRRVDLVTNHRCPREVVVRAARLVAHGRERFDKRILPRRDAPGTLTLAPDAGDAVARARRLLSTWLPAGEGGHAVLARTNAELEPYAAVALETGIPHRVEEDGLLLHDGAVADLLARAAATDPSWPLVLRLRAALGDRAGAPNLTAPDPAATDGSPSRALVERSALGWAAAFDTLEGFAAALAARRVARESLRTEDASLVLATVHGTKGLEFDHVAVIGLDEGVFPSRRSVEESSEPARALEEERRLAYVAWTRARRSLTLVYDPYAPSPFLLEAFEPHELSPPGAS
jgi:DNA helicase-2/ATP-dependent DNA helicase PcrA